MDAVLRAEEDLEAVSSLMSVEDQPAAAEPFPEPAVEKGSGGWEVLAESLGDAEMGYLKRCIHGTKTDVRLEKAVNSAAQDAIGDVVLEGGRVVEDYVDEVRRMVGLL